VGHIPAAPLELHRGGGEQLLDLAATRGAGGERRIRHALQELGPLPAAQALVLVDRHLLRLPSGRPAGRLYLYLSPVVLRRILIAPAPISSRGRSHSGAATARTSWRTWKAYIVLPFSAAPCGPWVQISMRVRRPSTSRRSRYSSASSASSTRSSIR